MPELRTKSGIVWRYEERGAGAPLLFLHGWGASHRVFVQQQEYFSRKSRVVLVDLPGHGRTSWQPVSFEAIADDIQALMQALGVLRMSIVGSSMGGALGLKIYERFPLSVERLVMVGSLPRFCRSPGFPLGLERAQFEKLKDQLAHQYPAILEIFFRSLFTIEERQDPKFQWIHQFRRQEAFPLREALVDFLKMLGEQDFIPMFEKIKIPVQLIAGDHDYICPPDSFKFLRALLPQARFDTIRQSGHFPFLIRSEEFNRVVDEFLF